MNRRRMLLAGAASVILPLRYAHAQSFPAHAITLYCAFPPGGPTDQLFRLLAESVSKDLGQPVIVENKPGGGGTLALAALKNAKPDGYTLSQMPLGVFRVPHMQKVPQIDPLQDYVDFAKKNPGKVNYGSTGWAPHVDAGKLRLLAVYGSKRAKRWPDVPTLAELGYSTVSDSPFGIAGPAGMSAAVVRTLHDAFRRALGDPKVLALLERLDQPVIYMGPEEYTKFAKQTFEEERRTIDRLALKGTM